MAPDKASTGQASLRLYVSDACWSCAETRRIVADVTPAFPELRVEWVDLGDRPFPDDVFAVPTYALDGRVIYLGNPSRVELRRRLRAYLGSTVKRG